ncbi:MAG: hypothetical protein ACK4TA_03695 [Saprospiraceae bacterium]
MKSKNLLHSSLGFWQNHTKTVHREFPNRQGTYSQSWNSQRLYTHHTNVSPSKVNDYASKKEYYTIFISDKIFFRILFSIAAVTILISAISLISYTYQLHYLPEKDHSAVHTMKTH